MAEETTVIEKETPVGKTNFGDKFRAAMPTADKLETAPVEKKPDALSVALGENPEKKEEKPGTNGEWEKEDVLKEFDPNKANWGNARKVMGTQSLEKKAQQKQIDRLTADLAEAKKAGASATELTELREQLKGAKDTLAEREERIKAINAEYSDEYRALTAVRDSAVTKAISRFKAYGGDADRMAEIIQLPEGKVKSAQLKEALADLEPEDKTRVISAIEKIGEADEQIADFRKDLPSKWDEISKKREEALREDRAKTMKALESNFEKIARTLPETSPLLTEIDGKIDGADKWNAGVKSAFAGGLKTMRGDATFEENVAVAIKGHDYDRISKILVESRAELDAANKRLAEFDRGGADFRGGKKPQGGDEKLSGGDKYRKALSAAQGAEDS